MNIKEALNLPDAQYKQFKDSLKDLSLAELECLRIELLALKGSER